MALWGTAIGQVRTTAPEPVPGARAVVHAFEIYPGTHTSQVAVRFQDHAMPFFSSSLSFTALRR
jgi:hypothetical protein